MQIASTPQPPYYAVIFTSSLSPDHSDYGAMSDRMVELAGEQDGFLGIESARDSIGITVSYWADEESIRKWKSNVEHQEAQRLGREKWYARFFIRVCKVERAYSMGMS